MSEPDAREMTAVLLIGAGREFDRRLRAALAERDLHPRQVYILDVLEREGGVGQRELGEMLEVDHSLLVTLLNPLEADKLIERQRSEGDRRRHQVVITPAGRRLLKRGLATMEKVQTDLLRVLDKRTRADLRRALQELRSGLATVDGDCVAGEGAETRRA